MEKKRKRKRGRENQKTEEDEREGGMRNMSGAKARHKGSRDMKDGETVRSSSSSHFHPPCLFPFSTSPSLYLSTSPSLHLSTSLPLYLSISPSLPRFLYVLNSLQFQQIDIFTTTSKYNITRTRSQIIFSNLTSHLQRRKYKPPPPPQPTKVRNKEEVNFGNAVFKIKHLLYF